MPASSASGASTAGSAEPVELRVVRSEVARHARDCGSGVPTRRTRCRQAGCVLLSSPRSWRRRSAGAAAAARAAREPALPRLLARAAPAAAGARATSRRALLRACRLRGPGAGAGARAEVPRGAGRGRLMAAAIVATAPEGLFAGAALVPVPAHARARAPARLQPGARCSRDALARRTGCRWSPASSAATAAGSQVGRGRAERARALAGVDTRVARTPRPPRDAVLVDDVVTTGATLAAGARAPRGGRLPEPSRRSPMRAPRADDSAAHAPSLRRERPLPSDVPAASPIPRRADAHPGQGPKRRDGRGRAEGSRREEAREGGQAGLSAGRPRGRAARGEQPLDQATRRSPRPRST